MPLKERFPSFQSVIDMSPIYLSWAVLEDLRSTARFGISLHQWPSYQANLYKPINADSYQKLELTIAEALQWLLLRGLLVFTPQSGVVSAGMVTVSSRGRAIQDEPGFRAFLRHDAFNLDTLHPRLRRKVVGHFHDGEYDTAVFQAFKEVEKAARGAAKMPSHSHGSGLLERAFKAKVGPIADPTLEDEEQRGDEMLVVGAFKRYRNASGHRDVDYDDIVEVAEILSLASLILRKIEPPQ
jgi:uncharacterized protein (TIGR02391 family)